MGGHRAEFERRKLREPSQLPHISETSFVPDWDFADRSHRDTLIKHGDQVIFTEPALYEGYERFIEIAEILRDRYGSAVRDLIPTPASELYLYGDHSSSQHRRRRSAQENFLHLISETERRRYRC